MRTVRFLTKCFSAPNHPTDGEHPKNASDKKISFNRTLSDIKAQASDIKPASSVLFSQIPDIQLASSDIQQRRLDLPKRLPDIRRLNLEYKAGLPDIKQRRIYIQRSRFDIRQSFRELKPAIKELPGSSKELPETIKELLKIKKEQFLPSVYFFPQVFLPLHNWFTYYNSLFVSAALIGVEAILVKLNFISCLD